MVAQALEELDKDVLTADRIRLDRAVHCVRDGDRDESETTGGSEAATESSVRSTENSSGEQ